MATFTVPVADVFKYFGSRDEVRRRFAVRIRSSLEKMTGLDAALLSEELGLPRGMIKDIVTGKLDGLTHEVVEVLADALDFGIEVGFTPFGDFPPDEQEAWRRIAQREEFFFVAGATNEEPSDIEQLKMFVILCAFRQL